MAGSEQIWSAVCCAAVAFQLYDKDGDGFVSAKELLNVLRTIMGRALSDKQLEQVSHCVASSEQ